jgi:hypothetical protein
VDDEHEWKAELRRVVDDCGLDSAFDEKERSTVGQDNAVQTAPTPAPTPEDASTLRIVNGPLESSSSSVNQQHDFFIIPTLPIALSTAFFTALGSQGPIDRLTVPHLLPHPAALLLNLSSNLKNMLSQYLPNFWEDKLPTAASHSVQPNAETFARHLEKEEWNALFEHLLAGRQPLVQYNAEEIEVESADEGYGLADLNNWIAGWIGDRQRGSSGEKDVGVENGNGQARGGNPDAVVAGQGPRDGKGSVRAGQGFGFDHGNHGADREEGEAGERGRKRKHVSWNEPFDASLVNETEPDKGQIRRLTDEDIERMIEEANHANHRKT